MKKSLALVGGILILFTFLTSCETVKGVGRDIMNLGDVLTGKKPSHTTPLREQEGVRTQYPGLDTENEGLFQSDQTTPKDGL